MHAPIKLLEVRCNGPVGTASLAPTRASFLFNETMDASDTHAGIAVYRAAWGHASWGRHIRPWFLSSRYLGW